uniref:Uncharacterized protein n=1 Tax=Arundo donax TaxID=35708 RepID=A0A0A9CCE8_ARUDO
MCYQMCRVQHVWYTHASLHAKHTSCQN